MVLNLQKVYQPANRSYNIIIRNHRDNFMTFCAPHDAEYVHFGRWLDKCKKCTELNITNAYGRTASVQLEDDDWRLIVTGNIKGGRRVVNVGGSKDFDIKFTSDGHMILQCWDGTEWGMGTGNIVDILLVPFQKVNG
ncbi:hypothetical protein GGR53DRAFT_46242 [Hypoxylon sp. FL1150]|nr:hypothetical protein GGR53DRAFT_46242 [Hypoxylon sp. FL1150]